MRNHKQPHQIFPNTLFDTMEKAFEYASYCFTIHDSRNWMFSLFATGLQRVAPEIWPFGRQVTQARSQPSKNFTSACHRRTSLPKGMGGACKSSRTMCNLYPETKQKPDKYKSSWWLNQPIWKICSSKWESSPNRDENKKIFETTT